MTITEANEVRMRWIDRAIVALLDMKSNMDKTTSVAYWQAEYSAAHALDAVFEGATMPEVMEHARDDAHSWAHYDVEEQRFIKYDEFGDEK